MTSDVRTITHAISSPRKVSHNLRATAKWTTARLCVACASQNRLHVGAAKKVDVRPSRPKTQPIKTALCARISQETMNQSRGL
jgi:hypothetical protein